MRPFKPGFQLAHFGSLAKASGLFFHPPFSEIVSAWSTALTGAAAAADPIALREPLDRTWEAELIHADYAFAPGEWRSPDVQGRAADGRVFPAQWTDVERHGDGSIKSAQVARVVTLEPKEVLAHDLHPGNPVTEGGLRLVRDGEALEVTNGLVGARFSLGERQFDPPVEVDEVPAFLTAVRLRGGAWTGRGWFVTLKKCRGYKIDLVECGPVLPRMAFEYRFDGFRVEGGDVYRGTAQITAVQEII